MGFVMACPPSLAPAAVTRGRPLPCAATIDPPGGSVKASAERLAEAPAGYLSPCPDAERKECAMPRQWTDKQERKYQHIVDSEKDQGASTKRAKEIAARTVNKERARRGQAATSSRTSTDDISSSRRGGLRSGKPGPRGRTRDQLYNEARQKGIEGRSKMNKAQLQRAVDARR
jgi:hypothetical protein